MAAVVHRGESSAKEAQPKTPFFIAHAPFMKRTLLRLGVMLPDVEDVLQQVFLVVARRYDDYSRADAKRDWLLEVSELAVLNYHRDRRRALRRGRWPVLVTTFDLEEVLLRREAARIVAEFLAGLKESERAPFYLAELEGLTAREIALELDVNMNTIYTRLRAARRRFSRVLARLS